MAEFVRVSTAARFGTITIDRPARRNALNLQVSARSSRRSRSSHDQQEGMRAFAEKRTALYRGR